MGKLRPFIANSVRNLRFHFFSTHTPQTGFLPPISFTADGATYKRKCRQFHGCNVLISNSSDLIQSVSLGQDVLSEGKTGDLLTKSIVERLAENHIICDQVSSTVFDGAYHHVGVPRLLRERFGFTEAELPAWWDWMHRLGIIDKHLGEQNDFKWLSGLVKLCQQIYHEYQWGNQYEHLKKSAEELDIAMRNLQNFSDTRFANSKRNVFLNIFLMIKPILSALEDDVMRETVNRSGLEASDPQIRKRGLKARQLRGSIFDKQTLLLLAGTVDIYLKFGSIVNVVQEFKLFPHHRYDKFLSTLDKLKEVITHLQVEDCPGLARDAQYLITIKLKIR